MNNDTVTIEGYVFANLAQNNQDILDMVVDCVVIHPKYGQGKITRIVKRDNYLPIIYILFNSDYSELKFNSDSFKNSEITPINVPKQFIDVIYQRKKEQEMQTEFAKQEEERKRKAEAIENHKTFLLNRKIEYKGIRDKSKLNPHRVTCCYICKKRLDNSIDVECSRCGWIICSCGACGCGWIGSH